MNALYHMALALLIGSSLLIDFKKLQKQPKLAVTVYTVVFAISIGLWVFQLFEVSVPMPTQLLLRNIYPWLQSFVHPGV